VLFGDSLQDCHELHVGVVGGFRPAQQRHVAGFQRQPEGVNGDVRPRLVHHSHDPQRHPHLPHLNPIGHHRPAQHLPYRIREGGYLPKPVGDAANPFFV
jgi:hypothetical protein